MDTPDRPPAAKSGEDVGALFGSLERLYASVLAARNGDPATSRTAKLMREGITKMAKKLAEEAVEVALDAVLKRREHVILESADLLYNLCVLWAASDITPTDVTAEIIRREKTYGIAEKLPKGAQDQANKIARGWDVTP